MPEVLIGKVSHYYSRIDVAALSLEAPLHTGDRIHIVGRSTDLQQTVESMEIEHRNVDAAAAGDDVAIRVTGKVRGATRSTSRHRTPVRRRNRGSKSTDRSARSRGHTIGCCLP